MWPSAAALIRPSRLTTTSTAASCRMCCGSWWRRRSCWNAEHRLSLNTKLKLAGTVPGVPRMKPQTKREYLRDLVVAKNQWSRPLTDEERALGFLGWHERGYLPHCDFPGLVQFVTFRLADSMPASRRGEWEHLLGIEDVREKRTRLEEYLDRGMGECHLRDPRIAKIAEDALLHFQNK